MMDAIGRYSALERLTDEVLRHSGEVLLDAGISLAPRLALLLARIEDRPRPVGYIEQTAYCGSNVSYNIAALAKGGYITTLPSDVDRRATLVELTERGRGVRDLVRRGLEGFSMLRTDVLQRRLELA